MTAILLALGLSAAPAFAQEDRPLAIPNDSVATPQLALPPMTSEQARAARQYRAQRLMLQSETELHGGGGTVIHHNYGPRRYGHYGMSYVARDPIYAVPSWGIYRGPERLTVPEYLGSVGRVGQKADLEAKVERLERRSKRWYTLGTLGILTTIGGVVTQIAVDDPATRYYSHYATLGGAGAMVVGFVGGSFPNAKADQLENDPAEWLEAGQIQQEIDDYNADLGNRLGLSPEQQIMLETAPQGVRWSPRVHPNQQGGVTIGVGATF